MTFAPAAAARRAAEVSALDAYLGIPADGSHQIPTLEAAIRDARETMKDRKALWLATLGYLIVVEMLGQSVARPGTAFPNRGTPTNRFLAGAQEFSARPITPDDARALYGLRCAFAHEYGLRSNRSAVGHVFKLDRVGSLVKAAKVPWRSAPDPSNPKKRIWPSPVPDNQTEVNVFEVGVFVEELVGNVRSEHQVANVVLAPRMDPMQLRNFGQFLIR
ncbi:MAG: hypothetical protein ABSB09_02870 [Acidimicrobiales bacterium]|jgi:hypothetical protein